MLDFGEGWSWFVAGFSATVGVTVLLLLVVAVAKRSHSRHTRRLDS